MCDHNKCKKCKNDSGGGFVNGVLFGALVGTITGIMMAPDTGKNTQRKIKAASKKAKADIDPILKDLEPLVEKMVTASEPTRQEISDAISQLVEAPKEEKSKKKKSKKGFFKK